MSHTPGDTCVRYGNYAMVNELIVLLLSPPSHFSLSLSLSLSPSLFVSQAHCSRAFEM